MNDVLEALQGSSAYEHSVGAIVPIETHLSWIVLTGDYAYKLKKPLKLPFVDFSTLEKREHYCHEEVRLNQRYTTDLYVGVLPIVRAPDGTIYVSDLPVADDCTVLEWAVKMRQFAAASQGDELVAANAISDTQFFEFGLYLAEIHAVAEKVVEPNLPDAIRENFETLRSVTQTSIDPERLDQLRSATEKHLSRWREPMLERGRDGYVRECHGDLHLSNIMLHDQRLQAFDCLEFSLDLRSIDVWNDVAFLVMDCCVRDRADLAYSFVDGYLSISGDYRGALLLSLFAQYRSMIRAKVAAIAYDQSEGRDRDARQRLQRHFDWAEDRVERAPGRLVLCCGLSGSGKSYWSERLVPALSAIRLRSDVLRKVSAGLSVIAISESGLGSGLYDPGQSNALYSELAELSFHLLQEGENVIVDATYLRSLQRVELLEMAKQADSKSVVLHFTAPTSVLEERILRRQRLNTDASEADLAVLAWQQRHEEVPSSPEPVLVVDTCTTNSKDLVNQVVSFFQS